MTSSLVAHQSNDYVVIIRPTYTLVIYIYIRILYEMRFVVLQTMSCWWRAIWCPTGQEAPASRGPLRARSPPSLRRGTSSFSSSWAKWDSHTDTLYLSVLSLLSPKNVVVVMLFLLSLLSYVLFKYLSKPYIEYHWNSWTKEHGW